MPSLFRLGLLVGLLAVAYQLLSPEDGLSLPATLSQLRWSGYLQHDHQRLRRAPTNTAATEESEEDSDTSSDSSSSSDSGSAEEPSAGNGVQEPGADGGPVEPSGSGSSGSRGGGSGSSTVFALNRVLRQEAGSSTAEPSAQLLTCLLISQLLLFF